MSTRPVTAMGFDHGRLRIGVAVGQTLTSSAEPVAVLTTRGQHPDWDAIARLTEQWRPDVLVVGVPRHADGSASRTTAATEGFARALRERLKLPVHTIDERLSSREARARLGTRGRRRTAIDAGAAAVILESWFRQWEVT